MSDTTAYEWCYACSGSGAQDYGSHIGTCSLCRGDCYIRVRDAKGRFATKAVFPDDES